MRWLALVLVAACGFSTRVATAPDDGGPGGEGTDALDPDAPDAAPTPAGCRAVELEAMSAQTCARRDDGEVWCWGRNEDGAIGVTTNVSVCSSGDDCVKVPTKVALPAAATRLGLGDRHSCAIAGAKTYCWGFNGNGQFGDNSTNSSATPREIPLRAAALALRGGDLHTCSRHVTGVLCSGRNQYGEIGDQSTTQRETPTAAGLTVTATTIGTGYHHSCAIASGAVYCWGENTSAQVDTSGNTPVTSPRAVNNVSNATAVVGGARHTCARLGDGSLRCWGNNSAGQLGVGDTATHDGPQTLGLTGVTQLVAGADHTCALAGSGVWCWGEGYTSAPTQVNLGANALAVAAGSYHDCAILADGTVRCWGFNAYGQLGNNTTTTSATPVQAVVCP